MGKTLEERYNDATNETYVGRVKMLQANEVATRGVNFLDGDPVGTWSPGRTDSPDKFQNEFIRNKPGDFRYGGGGKVPGTYALTRWLDKSLKIAFDGEGPTSRPMGYWHDSKFTLLNDMKNSNVQLHNFVPLPNKSFSDSLNPLAKGRVTGTPSGPSPAGLNG